jgi:hypothetical protein
MSSEVTRIAYQNVFWGYDHKYRQPEMSRYAADLITLVGAAYLLLGLAALVFPVMFLLYAPKSAMISAHSLIYFGYKIVVLGPCFLIAYAFIRRRKWGQYLLIAYNGLWLTYVTFALVAELVTEPKPLAGPVLIVVLLIYIILGGLIAIVFQKDVRALMSH